MDNTKWEHLTALIYLLSKFLYFVLSLIVLGIALFLVGYGLWEVWLAAHSGSGQVADKLLNAVGVIVISLALFDVSKYLMEEEVLRKKRLSRTLGETRQTMLKFLTIVTIAVCLEALIFIFRAGSTNVETLLYPTLLLLSGVLVVIGLAAYLRITATDGQSQNGKSK